MKIPSRPIPHTALMIISGILLLAIFLIIFTRCTTYVRQGIAYTTSDNRYDVWEGQHYIEAIRLRDMQNFRGRWEQLPLQLRYSIKQTRFTNQNRRAAR